MEFSYRISEADFLNAWKLRLQKRRLPLPVRLIVFWLFVMVCLMVLWAVVQKGATSKEVQYSYSDLYSKVQAGEVQDAAIQGDELRGRLKGSKEIFHTTLPANYDDLEKAMIAAGVNVTIKAPPSENGILTPLLLNVGPFILLIGVWFLMLRRLGAMNPRRTYRKDPTMQGEFTVEITPQGIATRNTAGTSSLSGWNVYNDWREGKNLIVLMMRSGGYFTLNVSGLSDMQRQELRGILASALPKR
jgi:hypothetical protein